MLILSIRTDNPDAEVGLHNGTTRLAYEVWQAHRELGTTIHRKIQQVLDRQSKDWKDIQGVVAFKGPGSFTGLRIGLSVGNALAFALGIPIVSMENPQWLEYGIAALIVSQDEKIAIPEYGASVHISEQRK